jgi:CRISPR-associated exonuclease Cas4
MAREIHPDQEDPFIEIGRILSEESYKREKKNIYLEGMIIDIMKVKDGEVIIGEVKKSSRFEKAAKMQLSFYLLKLKRMGIEAKGELLFPREKKKVEVILTDEIENELKIAEEKIKSIINLDRPPEAKKIKFCKNCAYEEFCFS